MGPAQRVVLHGLIGAAKGLSLSCKATIHTPVISYLTPTSAPVGTNVVIMGTSLTGAASITFDNLAISVYGVDSANSPTTFTASEGS